MRCFILLLALVGLVTANNPILAYIDSNPKTVIETKDDVYKAPFEISITHADVKFSIVAQMYLIKMPRFVEEEYTKIFEWKIYFIPTDFYKIVKKSKITNNDQLEADDILNTFDSIKGHQGGKISVTRDKAGNWIANVDDLKFSDAKIATLNTVDGKWHGIAAYKLGKAMEKGGTIKVTHLFSKAIDDWFKEIGVGKVTLQDNAYFPCGAQKPYTPPVAQLFIRIWLGKTQLPSLYMKPGFGSYELPNTDGKKTKQKAFLDLAKKVHDTTLKEVLDEMRKAGETEKKIKEMTALINTANSNHIKGMTKRKKLEYRNNVAKWEAKDTLTKTMADVFAVLWYMGDESKCGKYVTVFKWLYGTEDREDYSKGCTKQTDFCKNLHKLRGDVQHLEKVFTDQKTVKRLSFDSKFQKEAWIIQSDSFYDATYEKVWYAMNGHAGYYKGFPQIKAAAEINFFSTHGITTACQSVDIDQRDKWNKISNPPTDTPLKTLFPGKKPGHPDYYNAIGSMVHDYTMNACGDCGKHSGIFKIKAKCRHSKQEETDDNDICQMVEKERLILPPDGGPGLAFSEFMKSKWFLSEPGRIFFIGCRTIIKDKPKLVGKLGKIEKLKVKGVVEEIEEHAHASDSSDFSVLRSHTDSQLAQAVTYKYNKYPNQNNRYDAIISEYNGYPNRNENSASNGNMWAWIVLLEMSVMMFCIGGVCCCVGMSIGGMIFFGVNYHSKRIVNESRDIETSNEVV